MKKSVSVGISSRRSRSGWDGELDDLEPVVEVFAEIAAHHHLLEVAVRGRHDTHVHLDALVAPQLGELGVLQHVEQLRLQRRLHLADLVEHEGAAVRLLELADAGRRGTGEGTPLVAEELALEEVGRERRAVDLHERTVAACGALMDRARRRAPCRRRSRRG